MWTVFSMDDLTNRWQSLLLTEEKEAKVDLMKEKKRKQVRFWLQSSLPGGLSTLRRWQRPSDRYGEPEGILRFVRAKITSC